MQRGETRPYKIDLIISKRRKQTLSQSVRKDQFEGDIAQEKKEVHHRKRIHLTVANQISSNRYQIKTNPQLSFNIQSNVAISEFKIEMPLIEQEGSKIQRNCLMSVREKSKNQEEELWWKYLKSSQQESRLDIVKQLAKKGKKIQYFIDLLNHQRHKFGAEKRQKIEKYESFLSKLKQMYTQQLQQAQKLCNTIKQWQNRNDEQIYHQLRLRINKDGKQGLNFSPKRMSLFSGISGTLLLSKKTSGSQQRRRNYNEFSFGSSLRKITSEQSQTKTSKGSRFLDEGRISIYKKRLNFHT